MQIEGDGQNVKRTANKDADKGGLGLIADRFAEHKAARGGYSAPAGWVTKTCCGA